jgi:hypothetical protein
MSWLQKYAPEDWADMIGGLVTWAQTELGETVPVILSHGDSPAPAKPYVWLSLVMPPLPQGQGDSGTGLRLSGVGVVVKSVVEGATYRVTVDGSQATYVAEDGDDADDVITGLIASLDGIGVDASLLQVSPVTSVLLADVDLTEVPMTVGDRLAMKIVRSTEHDANVTLGVDVMGRSRVSGVDTWESSAMALRLQTSLDSPDVQAALRLSGWSFISIEGVRKADRVAGSQWEDRSGFDARLRCRTRRLSTLDWIEDAGTIAGAVSA